MIVEVRTRGATSFDGPLASVDWKKRARLLEAADRLWRERLSREEGIERLRIDVVGVTFDTGDAARIEHIEGAITG